jgi:hypothetical protein
MGPVVGLEIDLRGGMEVEIREAVSARTGLIGRMALACSETSVRGEAVMEREEMLDHPDAAALVKAARDELGAGNDKQAARLLTDAAYHTHDPEIERQVRELAAEGLNRAGRFGKGRWEEIIRIADLHVAKTEA